MQSDLMGRDELLTDREIEDLTVGFLEHSDGGATVEEVEAMVEWARGARVAALLVDMVLAGEIVILEMKDGEPLLGNA